MFRADSTHDGPCDPRGWLGDGTAPQGPQGAGGALLWVISFSTIRPNYFNAGPCREGLRGVTLG